jgi:hypothetical protein
MAGISGQLRCVLRQIEMVAPMGNQSIRQFEYAHQPNRHPFAVHEKAIGLLGKHKGSIFGDGVGNPIDLVVLDRVQEFSGFIDARSGSIGIT